MGITHVIRGEDHLSNTAKHIALFRAFGVEPPKYAHIPLILNIDGTKMSKRDKGASLGTYLAEGYVPEAVVNYLYLLGWSPKDNREMLPLQEVIQMFDLPQILRHNARFDLNKLNWLNWEYIRSMPKSRFEELAVLALARSGINVSGFDSHYISSALATCQAKVKQLDQVALFTDFYFIEDFPIDPEAFQKDFPVESKPRIQRLRDAFAQVPQFDAASLEKTLKGTAAELGIKAGPLVHPTRVACTGKTVGPGLYELMEVLGRETVLKRLDRVLARIGG